MAGPTKRRHGGATDGQWERWQLLATVATKIAAIFLEPLLDHLYGGNGSGRHL